MEVMRVKELTNLLDLANEEEFDDYTKTITISKALDIYDKVKSKTDIENAISALSEILEASKFRITKGLSEELLTDDELRAFILTKENVQGKLLTMLSENVIVSKDEDDEIKDLSENADEVVNEASKYIDEDVKDFPLYSPLKERLVFQKYHWLKLKLDIHIKRNSKKPEYQDFIDYIEHLYDNENIDKRARGKNKDPFIVRALGELYRDTDNPIVTKIQNEPEIVELVGMLKDLRDDINFHNVRLVRTISKQHMNRGLPLADLDQEGTLGLLKAINKFEPKGLRFSTMAVPWIRQSVRRAIANEGNTIRIPVNLVERIYRVKKVRNQIIATEAIEEPSPERIYEECKKANYGYSLEQVKRALEADEVCNPLSTDKPVGEEEDSSLIDFITVENNNDPEIYAEVLGIIRGVKDILDEVSREDTGHGVTFVQLHFGKRLQSGKKDEFILLTKKEYEELIDKGSSAEEKRKKLEEFLTKYKLSSNMVFEGKRFISLSKGQRNALIYALRNGVAYQIPDTIMTTSKFVARRNFNNAFFESNSEKTSNKLTLEATGKLFGVTRERIRQLEAKVDKKVKPFLEGTSIATTDFCDVYLDGKTVNVYDALKISSEKSSYKLIFKKNTTVDIDDDGNIIPIEPGEISVRAKGKNETKKLVITVNPSLKESVKCSTSRPRVFVLKLDENKKDNQ